jgi:hypothetical protein
MRQWKVEGRYEPVIPIRQDFIKGQFYINSTIRRIAERAGGLRQAYQFQQFSLNRIQLHCIHPVGGLEVLGHPLQIISYSRFDVP